MPFSSNEKLVINIVVFLSKWPNGDYYWQSRKVTGSSWWKDIVCNLQDWNLHNPVLTSLSIGEDPKQSKKKNHGQHEITMKMSDSNSLMGRLGYFFYLP